MGIDTGRKAGSYRIDVSDQGMSYEQGDLSDLPTVIDFDAGSLVLTPSAAATPGPSAAIRRSPTAT